MCAKCCRASLCCYSVVELKLLLLSFLNNLYRTVLASAGQPLNNTAKALLFHCE
eukprot:m.5609 g.5609  ORF g.5609 m.5609 type:complete len:54 (+) comp5068_c0_seq1:1699-1860(+)